MMNQCDCGSTEFKSKMVTTADVLVTSVSGYPEHILGSEDTQDINFIGPFICTKCGRFHLDIEDNEANVKVAVKRCACGNTRFSAHQQCYHDVIVDSGNVFVREDGVYDTEHPYGSYCCTQCGAEYEYLEELDELAINKGGNG